MNNYVSFHTHTELSLLDSCTNFKLYVDKAKEYGMTALAFSEHGNIFNYVEKKMYCDKAGIKYLHGVELYLTERLEPKVRDNYHVILIAKNQEGFYELNRLIDISTQQDHFYYKNRISFDEFLSISDNIIKISACVISPLNRLSDTHEYYDRLANKYDFYEIQPHKLTTQIEYNKRLYILSQKHNKPLIAGGDFHSISNYKAECRSILQKAKNIEYSDEDTVDLVFKPYADFVRAFEQQDVLPKEVYLKAIENTNTLNDLCEGIKLDTTYKYPKLYEDDEKKFKETIARKYKEKLTKGIITDDFRYIENIREESRVFKKLGMYSFMLFMSELCTWCRENDIPIGYCRGSVGGSTIAYILDIIDVNPIKWNTIFSRFANEDRIEVGDIDVDIAPSDRDKVFNYIIDRFGNEYTAYILAVTTIAEKGTIDEIGRALKYSLNKVEIIKNEYEENPEKAKQDYSELFYYFDGLINTTISQSMHPAGIVISPIPLPSNFGTFNNSGKRIMQINMEEIHEINLVKYDILGLKNIGIIKDAYKLVGERYKYSHEIDWEDEKVWNDTVISPVGIFQFESDYSFDLLKRYKPKKINDLSLINASLRPSGASFRDKLIAREFNKNPSIIIDELLKQNNGFLTFQEDVIAFLQHICGLTGSEADNVRRAIGRKRKDILDKALPRILEGYCAKSNQPREISEKEAKEFIQIIEDSSEYMFGYNHSTGYSMIGYTCAYLRYHHPLEFVTAFLNNALNSDDIRGGTELAKIKGIKINPIKFRYSTALYNCDKNTNSIYKGISSIKYCNEKIAEELFLLGKNNYNSFVDLLVDIAENTSVDTRQLEILIRLNFFSEFGKALKLYNIYDEFTNGKIKYDVKHKLTTKEKRVKMLVELEYEIADEDFPITELLKAELEYMGYISTVLPRLEYEYVVVTDINCKYKNPILTLYHLQNGTTEVIKVKKNTFDKNLLEVSDVIRIKKRFEDWKWQYIGDGDYKRLKTKEWFLSEWNIIT